MLSVGLGGCSSKEDDAATKAKETARPKQHLYVLGGETSGRTPATRTYRAAILPGGELGPWEDVADLALRREALSAAVTDDGALLVVGGEDPGMIGDDRALLLANLAEIGPWKEMAPLSSGRSFASATVAGGQWLFVIGGLLGSGTTDDVKLSRVDVNGAEGWTTVARPPQPLMGHASLAIGSRLYVIGGWIEAGGPTAAVVASDLEPRLEIPFAFRDVGSLPAPRTAHVAVATAKGIVVAGGREDEGTDAKADVFMGSVQGDGTVTWNATAPMPAPRAGACAVSDGDTIYVLGGVAFDRGEPSTTAFVGRVSADGKVAWSETTPLPEGRYLHACAGY